MTEWRGRLTQIGHRLLHSDGADFIPVQFTAFGLCSEKATMEEVAAYVDARAAEGCNGFRMMIGCAWGGQHHGEDGWGWQWAGMQYPAGAQDRTALNEPLFQRIEAICTLVRKRGMFIQLEIADGSQALIGADWYCAQDAGWDLLCQRVAAIYANHDNFIVSTGNEPARWWSDGRALKKQQKFLVNRLKMYGVDDYIGVDITASGLEDMYQVAGVSICNVHDAVRDCDYLRYSDWLRMLRQTIPDKVIWSNEPIRIGYPNWLSVDQLRPYPWITAMAGVGWTHHGLGSGPPFYGVGPGDGAEMMPFYRERMNAFHCPRNSGITKYWFNPIMLPGISGSFASSFEQAKFAFFPGGEYEHTNETSKPQMWRIWNLRTQKITEEKFLLPGSSIGGSLGPGDYYVTIKSGVDAPVVP